MINREPLVSWDPLYELRELRGEINENLRDQVSDQITWVDVGRDLRDEIIDYFTVDYYLLEYTNDTWMVIYSLEK